MSFAIIGMPAAAADAAVKSSGQRVATDKSRRARIVEALSTIADADMRDKPQEQQQRIQALLTQASSLRPLPLREMLLARKALAAAYLYAGDSDRGIAEIEAAVAAVRASPLAGSSTEAELVGNQAAFLSQLGKRDEAKAIFERLLPYWEKQSGRASDSYVGTLAEIAVINFRAGNPALAESQMAECVRLAKSTTTFKPHDVLRYSQNWAAILNALGRSAEAINELQAVSQFATTELGENNINTIVVLRNLSNALISAGRYAEAEAILRRVIVASKDVEGPTTPAVPVNLSNLARALDMQGKREEALPLHAAAYQHAVAHPDPATPSAVGDYMLNLATAQRTLGNLGEALTLQRKAVEEMRAAVGDKHPVYARAEAELGGTLLEAGDASAALPHLRTASTIYAGTLPGTHQQRLGAMLREGIARMRTGDQVAGYAIARDAAMTARAVLLDQITSPAQTMKTASQYALLFALHAEAALEAGRPDDAFEALQLSMLGDMDSAGAAYMARLMQDGGAFAPLVRELQDKEAAIASLRAKRSEHVAVSDTQEVARIDGALATAGAEAAALRSRIDAAFPAYRELIKPQPAPLAQVQRELAADDALLLATYSGQRVVSMLVTKSGVKQAVTAVPALQLQELATRVRRSINEAIEDGDAHPFDVDAAYRLYSALLPRELDRAVQRVPHLVVQTGGLLTAVPPSLLVTRQPRAGTPLRDVAWLIKRQAVSIPVSLGMLRIAPRERANSLRFAGIGAPTLSGREDARLAMRGLLRAGAFNAASLDALPPLPNADRELRSMATSFGSGQSLLLAGDDATRAKVLSADLSDYNVIAFATHGLVSGELRGLTEPSLVLTPGQQGGDASSALLSASDVAGLKLDADWVILSACNTAAGENAGAPMYSGLARAFVHAGARALLLSHWQVRDDVASRLSVETVQASVKGMDRAEALRRAQLRLIGDRSVPGGAHPATWAPFVLIGN